MSKGERSSVWFHEVAAPDIVDYAKNVCDLAILPIGAIEQHGPHCPCASDALNAIGMAELIAKKSGATVLPCPMYGSHPYHHWGVKGTIPLRFETHIALLEDIVRGASVAGFNKFIILSAHGQVSSTIVAVHKLGIEGNFVLSLHWYDFLRDNQEILDDPMWHADEAETSVALYLYPQFVDMSKAAPGSSTGLIDPKWKIAPGVMPKPGQMYHFEGTFAKPEKLEQLEGSNGVVGDPTKATLEKGEIIVTRLVDHVSLLVQEIMEQYPVGTKPQTA
jgi:creatinine amidohydrolase/Fe(II)-dependent formamide hydrolase-like protein